MLACRAWGADLHGVTGFDEYAEEHPETAEALTRRPSLASDGDYLRRHPSLAAYLESHPLARDELEGEDDSDTPPPKQHDDDDKPSKHPSHETHRLFTTAPDDAD